MGTEISFRAWTADGSVCRLLADKYTLEVPCHFHPWSWTRRSPWQHKSSSLSVSLISEAFRCQDPEVLFTRSCHPSLNSHPQSQCTSFLAVMTWKEDDLSPHAACPAWSFPAPCIHLGGDGVLRCTSLALTWGRVVWNWAQNPESGWAQEETWIRNYIRFDLILLLRVYPLGRWGWGPGEG